MTIDGEVWESISITYYQEKMKYGTLGLNISYTGDIENSIFPERWFYL